MPSAGEWEKYFEEIAAIEALNMMIRGIYIMKGKEQLITSQIDEFLNRVKEIEFESDEYDKVYKEMFEKDIKGNEGVKLMNYFEDMGLCYQSWTMEDVIKVKQRGAKKKI